MNPIRMKTEVPTDLEGVRVLLVKLGPVLEGRSPGISGQLAYFDMSQPLQLQGKGGEVATVRFEAQAGATAIKIDVAPPAKPMGRMRASWWRWRTRWLVKMALKRAKIEVERAHPRAKIDAQGTITPEVLPPG
jgi:hypothetical protein